MLVCTASWGRSVREVPSWAWGLGALGDSGGLSGSSRDVARPWEALAGLLSIVHDAVKGRETAARGKGVREGFLEEAISQSS